MPLLKPVAIVSLLGAPKRHSSVHQDNDSSFCSTQSVSSSAVECPLYKEEGGEVSKAPASAGKSVLRGGGARQGNGKGGGSAPYPFPVRWQHAT